MTEKSEGFALRRRAVVKAILAERGGMLVIGGLGSAAWDITDAGDSPLNFPLWGRWAAPSPSPSASPSRSPGAASWR
jgi:hypothetical protein